MSQKYLHNCVYSHWSSSFLSITVVLPGGCSGHKMNVWPSVNDLVFCLVRSNSAHCLGKKTDACPRSWLLPPWSISIWHNRCLHLKYLNGPCRGKRGNALFLIWLKRWEQFNNTVMAHLLPIEEIKGFIRYLCSHKHLDTITVRKSPRSLWQIFFYC